MTDFEKVWNFENLYRAYRKARRGKRWKGAAAKFEVNLLEALHLLSVQLRAKTYRLSPYNTFKVYEPKERIVMSNSYKDKVVQHALCDNVLGPRVLPSFIKDNYASQEGKGTHFGLERLEEFMRRFYRKKGVDGWVLKGDIRKYFYSIRHDVLKELVRKYVDDPECLWLLDMIIDSTEGNVGIPIGNQSSQLFALLYLSPLDHFIKEKLGIKGYARYMDDGYLIHRSKAYLKSCVAKIKEVCESLGITLNLKKTKIKKLTDGFKFLQVRFKLTETGKVLRKMSYESIKKMRRKLAKFKRWNEEGREVVIGGKRIRKIFSLSDICKAFGSWLGHMKRGKNFHAIQRMKSYFKTLFGFHPDNKVKWRAAICT